MLNYLWIYYYNDSFYRYLSFTTKNIWLHMLSRVRVCHGTFLKNSGSQTVRDWFYELYIFIYAEYFIPPHGCYVMFLDLEMVSMVLNALQYDSYEFLVFRG